MIPNGFFHDMGIDLGVIYGSMTEKFLNGTNISPYQPVVARAWRYIAILGGFPMSGIRFWIRYLDARTLLFI